MLGSLQDAEDALQEAMLAAWRALPGFEVRSTVRTWLYAIMRNVIVDMFRARLARPQVGSSEPYAVARDEVDALLSSLTLADALGRLFYAREALGSELRSIGVAELPAA